MMALCEACWDSRPQRRPTAEELYVRLAFLQRRQSLVDMDFRTTVELQSWEAVMSGRPEAFPSLANQLTHGQDLVLGETRATPLMLASLLGHAAMAKELLRRDEVLALANTTSRKALNKAELSAKERKVALNEAEATLREEIELARANEYVAEDDAARSEREALECALQMLQGERIAMTDSSFATLVCPIMCSRVRL